MERSDERTRDVQPRWPPRYADDMWISFVVGCFLKCKKSWPVRDSNTRVSRH